jgi:hypothetical protein
MVMGNHVEMKGTYDVYSFSFLQTISTTSFTKLDGLVAVALYTCIQEVLGLNLSQATGYPG